VVRGKKRLACFFVLLALLIGWVAFLRGNRDERPISTTALGQNIDAVAVDEHTGRVFIAVGRADGSGRLYVLDARMGAILHAVAMRANSHGHVHDQPIALAVDGRTDRVFVLRRGTTVGSLSTVDARNGYVLATTATLLDPIGLAVDDIRGQVFVANSGLADRSGHITMYPATGTGTWQTLAVPKGTMAVAVDKRTHRIVVARLALKGATASTAVTVYNTSGGRILPTMTITGSPAWRALTVDEATGHAFVLTVANGLTNAGQVSMFDTHSGRLVGAVLLNSLPEAAALDGRTGRVFVTTIGPARQVPTFNPSSLAALAPTMTRYRGIPVPGPTLTLVPYGQGNVYILDSRSGVVVKIVTVGVAPQDVAVGSSSGRVFVANIGPVDRDGYFAGQGSVSVLDARSGDLLHTVPVGVGAAMLTVDERTQRLFVANYGGYESIPDQWAWVPPLLRARLPLSSPPNGGAYPNASAVSMVDASR